MIRVAVIGAAGYAGGELLRLLLHHPHVGEQNITAVSASHAGKPVGSAHPDLAGDTSLTFSATHDTGVFATHGNADVIFLCQGHGNARTWMSANAPSASTRVIDLSVDHRLDKAWMYGLPELHRDAIRTSMRIANPGCFATAIELALLPLVGANGNDGKATGMSDRVNGEIHVTALTGSTGAGQAPSDTTHYSWRSNNVSVYKAFDHQHLPEIHAALQRNIVLIPMRGSWARGILTSCVVRTELSQHEAMELYRTTYAEHPFTHVVEDLPDVKRVVGTNKCFIGMQKQGDNLLVVSVIDNLLKGASGQAIQNMNLSCGLDEAAGLLLKPSAY